MNIQSNTPATPLRQRMIEDMRGRDLGRQSQRSHLDGCARFAAFLGRGPETATAELAGQTVRRAYTEGDCIDLTPSAELQVVWPDIAVGASIEALFPPR